MDYKNINEKVIEMERNIHRMEQYSCRKCIEIVGIPSSITNDLLEEHVMLIFEKFGYRLGEMNRVIFKL